MTQHDETRAAILRLTGRIEALSAFVARLAVIQNLSSSNPEDSLKQMRGAIDRHIENIKQSDDPFDEDFQKGYFGLFENVLSDAERLLQAARRAERELS